MGCDIHGYIEFSTESCMDKSWETFCKLHIARDYTLFAVLAGVRGDATPMFPPKGMPDIPSWRVKDENSIMVVEDEEYEGYSSQEHVTKRSTADSWVNENCSKYDAMKLFVTNPDWHNHSWLTLDELKEIQKEYKQWHSSYELEAIIATMESLKASGKISRFTFWFDN